MELRGLHLDKNNKIRYGSTYKRFIDYLKSFFIESSPEIILNKQEAKEWGIDIKKNPNGYYTMIDGVRVPVNIKD